MQISYPCRSITLCNATRGQSFSGTIFVPSAIIPALASNTQSLNSTVEPTMSTLKELLAQKAALEEQIDRIRAEERKNALANAIELITTFGLTSEELFPTKKATSKSVAVKYRDPQTGQTWSGRGRAPKWLDGHNKDDFKV